MFDSLKAFFPIFSALTLSGTVNDFIPELLNAEVPMSRTLNSLFEGNLNVVSC